MMAARSIGWKLATQGPHFQYRSFSSTSVRQADFTHVVIGGGVVGLAVARQLTSRHPDASTLVLERHSLIGSETSSRNSEVVHAGIYYGPGTLKTEMCIRGRHLLYDFCRQRDVPHRKTGKWIVAQNDAQRQALHRIAEFCRRDDVDVPVRWVSEDEARRLEPAVRTTRDGVLESPETGIVDSHGLMVGLQGLLEEEGGAVALNSDVRRITPLAGGGGAKGSGGWEVVVADSETGEESTIETETIINAAGLGAVAIHNMIAPPERQRELFYAKGNYFSYSHTTGQGSPLKVNRLIYPAPEPGFAGLGTHLTLDLTGRIRFGPDVEWVDSPHDMAVNEGRLGQAVEAIQQYLPGLDAECLTPDYTGIRPKLSSKEAYAQGKGASDFIIRKEEGFEGWVNLLGIESPGLTSSLAIAERVERLLYH